MFVPYSLSLYRPLAGGSVGGMNKMEKNFLLSGYQWSFALNSILPLSLSLEMSLIIFDFIFSSPAALSRDVNIDFGLSIGDYS